MHPICLGIKVFALWSTSTENEFEVDEYCVKLPPNQGCFSFVIKSSLSSKAWIGLSLGEIEYEIIIFNGVDLIWVLNLKKQNTFKYLFIWT